MSKFSFFVRALSLFGFIFVAAPQPAYAGESTNYPGSVSPSYANSALVGQTPSRCYAPQDWPGGDPITLTNFGFSIPTSDVITGMKVETKIGSRNSVTARMIRAGSPVGNTNTLAGNFAASSCNAAVLRQFGNDTEQWGTTWTPAQINASNFGVRVDVTGNNYAMIDWIRVTVYHNSPDVDLTTSKTTVGSVTATSMGDGNGGAWAWEITTTNIGTAIANYTSSHTILQDNLPAGPTYGTPVISSSSGVAPLPNCTISTNVLRCRANPASNIDPSGAFTVRIPTTPNSTGTYTNPNGICTADPNNNMGEIDENNNTCGPSTVTVTAPDLGVTKSSGGASPSIGDASGGQWTWTYSFTASGEDAVFSNGEVIFLDELPTNATYGAINQSLNGIAGTINCAIDGSSDLSCVANGTVTISSGDTMSLDFTVTPSTSGIFENPRSGGICTIDPNNAVNDGNASNNTCSDTVTVLAPNLTATKDDSLSAGIVAVGAPFTWVISVANSGSGDAVFNAGEAILIDDLPSTDATYGAVSVSNTTGISGTGTISCSINSFTLWCVATGGTVSIAKSTGAFDVEVTTTLLSARTFNNPRVAGSCAVDPGTTVPESNESDNACSDSIRALVYADLGITKTDGVTTAVPGAGITYTIVVTNNGPGDVTDASVTDTFPAELTATYTSVAAGGASGNTASGSGNLSETLNMPNGSSVTYTVSGAIAPSATGTISNTAAVSSASTEDSVSANDSATDSDTVLAPEADLSLTISNDATGLAAGQPATTYTIAVTNNGPSDATNVVVTDTLDADLNFTSTSGCAEDPSGVPTCALGTIAAGADNSYTVTSSVAGSAAGNLSNTASVTSDAVDNTSANDSGTDTDPIVEIDLTIAKSNDASNESIGAIAGAVWTWNVEVANTGADNAEFSAGHTILTDQLPTSNITYGAASVGSITNVTNAGNISCSISGGGLLTCAANGAPVTVGSGTGTFTVSFTATATAAATYTNAAATCLVDPDNVINETDENNTCGSDDSVLVAAPDLEVAKSNNVAGSADLDNAPTSWTWKLTLANTSAGVAEFASGETVFSDSLPDTEVSYGAVSVGAGTNTTGTVACSIDGSFDLICTASGGTFGLGGTTGSIPVSFTVTPSSATPYVNPRAGGHCSIDPNTSMTEDDESNNACSDTVTVTAPNLTAVKDDSAASGKVDVNIPFTWVITVANTGAGNAVFNDGETILIDNLPNTNISYGTVSIGNVTNVTNAGNISCSIANFDMTCTASGGAVTIGATTGTFDAEITTTVTAGGAHVNPRSGGICRVDPATNITEGDEADNDCADSVSGQVPDLRATKTNDVDGATIPGNPWTWTTSITNAGPGDAIFQSGQRIFTDDLPDTNISYGAVSTSNLIGITGPGTLSCSVTAFTINCYASGGAITIADSTGSVDVNITATPSAVETFDDPRTPGTCAVDPDNVITFESNEGNNACGDSVLVAVPGDLGDAPLGYPVRLASNGARHDVGGPLFLGAAVDGEPDGQPSAAATGDGADEDGVVFTSLLLAGQLATIDITASASGLLNAWVDFDGDGDWAGANEQVFTDVALVAGVNNLNFAVPAGATQGTTYARLRFNSAGGLSYTGLAADGEVEDYQVTLDSAVIGAAKQFTGTCDLPAPLSIDYTFENLGTQDLSKLTSVEDLTAVLGSHGVDWTFTSISSVPAVLANPSFNGDTITELLNQAPTQGLSSGSVGTITVTVQLLTSGTYTNQVSISGMTAGGVTASDQSTDGLDPDPNGDNTPDENAASVFACDEPPTIEGAFNPATIMMGGTSTLTFTITNINSMSLSGLNFTNTLPEGVTIADPDNLGGTCPTAIFASVPVAGGTTIDLTGSGILAPTSDCTISVDVTSAVAGEHVTSTGVVGSTETGPSTDTASASLTVIMPKAPARVSMLPLWALVLMSLALITIAFRRRGLFH